MVYFRNGKSVVQCDGCYKQIKRLRSEHCIIIDGHPAHAHAGCAAKARANAPRRAKTNT